MVTMFCGGKFFLEENNQVFSFEVYTVLLIWIPIFPCRLHRELFCFVKCVSWWSQIICKINCNKYNGHGGAYIANLLFKKNPSNFSLNLRKYDTHFFNTPLSNFIADNMMSRLIFTLPKQVFDNRFTYFNIKTWKVLCRMQVFTGTIFCCARSCRKKMLQYLLFFISDIFPIRRHIFHLIKKI